MGNHHTSIRHDYENAFHDIIENLHADYWLSQDSHGRELIKGSSVSLDTQAQEVIWHKIDDVYGEATADFYVAAFNEGHSPEVLSAMAKDFDSYLARVSSSLKRSGVDFKNDMAVSAGIERALDYFEHPSEMNYETIGLGGFLVYLGEGTIPSDHPEMMERIYNLTLEHFGLATDSDLAF